MLIIFISAVLYGVIAAYLLLRITHKVLSRHRGESKEYEQYLIDSLLESLGRDADKVFSHYQMRAGRHIEALTDGEAFAVHYTLKNDFLSAYVAQQFLIGKVKDRQLKARLIKTQTLMKHLDKVLRHNNALLDKCELASQQSTQRVKNANKQARFNEALISHAAVLSNYHNQFKQEIVSLLDTLDVPDTLPELTR